MRACAAILLLVIVGCGGATPGVRSKPKGLPPADPRAAEKYLEAARLIDRGVAAEDRAIALMRKSLDIDPNLWEAHYNLGVVYRKRGRLLRALEHFEAAHGIQPGADEPIIALAETRDRVGDWESAVELLEAFVEKRPDAAAARISLVGLLRQHGEHRRALAQARRVLVADSRNVEALLEVGRVHAARGDFDVAELVFRKALALDEKGPAPHNDLGLLALLRGDTQLAFEHFAAAVQAAPAYAPARLNRASVLLKAGDYAAAAVEYTAVLESDPGHRDARLGLGVCLRGQGKHAEARAEYEKVLADAPMHAAALFNLGVLHAEFLREPAPARRYFNRFLEAQVREDEHTARAKRYLDELAGPGGES